MDKNFDEYNIGYVVLYFCKYISEGLLLLKRLFIINTFTDTFKWKKTLSKYLIWFKLPRSATGLFLNQQNLSDGHLILWHISEIVFVMLPLYFRFFSYKNIDTTT